MFTPRQNSAGYVAAVVWVITTVIYVLIIVGCAGNREETATAQPAFSARDIQADGPKNPPSVNSLEEKWGITIEPTRLSAGGYMIDFRYRVRDPEKAKLIINPKTRPYMIDEATGAKFAVPSPPKVGDLRNAKNIVAGKVYFIFFANPGNYVKSGQKITVCIGDLKIEHLTVL